jgi:hypothetical protein
MGSFGNFILNEEFGPAFALLRRGKTRKVALTGGNGENGFGKIKIYFLRSDSVGFGRIYSKLASRWSIRLRCASAFVGLRRDKSAR